MLHISFLSSRFLGRLKENPSLTDSSGTMLSVNSRLITEALGDVWQALSQVPAVVPVRGLSWRATPAPLPAFQRRLLRRFEGGGAPPDCSNSRPAATRPPRSAAQPPSDGVRGPRSRASASLLVGPGLGSGLTGREAPLHFTLPRIAPAPESSPAHVPGTSMGPIVHSVHISGTAFTIASLFPNQRTPFLHKFTPCPCTLSPIAGLWY